MTGLLSARAVPSRTRCACFALEPSEGIVCCAAMGDEELYEKLTAVKGIGVLAMPVLDQSEHSTMAALI